MPTVAELDVQIDATNNAMDELRRVNAEIDRLSGRDATANIGAGTTGAQADIDRLIAALDRLAAKSVTVDVDATTAAAESKLARMEQQIRDMTAIVHLDTDTGAALAQLRSFEALIRNIDARVDIDIDTAGARASAQALKAQIDAMEASIKIDADTTGARGSLNELSQAAERAGTNMRGVIAGALLLWPALIPLTAAASAGVLGIASAATTAGIGIGLFGAVAVSVFGPVTEATKKIEQYQRAYNVALNDTQRNNALKKIQAELENLDPAQRAAVESIIRFKEEWRAFAQQFQPQIFSLAAKGLTLISDLLPSLTPIVAGTATAFDNLLNKAREALTGPFWQEFIAMVGRQAGPAIEALVISIGNIIKGFAGMLMAFEPFQAGFNQGMIEMTARFAEWGEKLGQSEGFRKFMDYVQSAWPAVKQALASLWQALVAIVVAVAPYGDVVLAALTKFFDAITALGNTSPMLLAMVVAFIGIAAAVISLLGPITSLLNIAALLGPAVAFLAGTLGMGAAAFGLIVVAVAAVVAALVYAYFRFETFRNLVDAVARGVVDAFRAVADWFSATFGPAIAAVVAFVSAEWQKMVTWAQSIAPQLQTIWTQIVDGVRSFGTIISGIWNALWPLLSNAVQAAWTIITAIISGALEIIRGIITAVIGLINMDWNTFWSGISMIVQGAWTIVAGIVEGALGGILGTFSMWGENARAAWEETWTAIRDFPQTIMTAIGFIISTGLDVIVGIISGWVTTVIGWFQNLYNVLVGGSIVPDMINAIVDWFAQLPARVIAIIVGFVTGVIAEFTRMATEAIAKAVELATGVVLAITTMVTSAATQMASFVANMATAFATWIANAASAAATFVANMATAFANFVANAASSFATFVANAASAFATWIANAASSAASFVANMASSFASFVANAASSFASFVSNAASSFASFVANAASSFANFVANAAASLGRFISNVISTFAQFVSTVVSSMAQAVSSLVSGFARMVASAASGMANILSAIRTGMSNALSAVRTGISNMVSAITGAVGRFASAGRAMIGGFVQGVRDRIGDAVDVVRAGVAKIAGLMPGSPAEWGPLSGGGYVYLRGQAFSEDLARGIASETDAVVRQAQQLARTMAITIPAPRVPGETTRGLARTGVPSVGTTINVQSGAITLELKLPQGMDPAAARRAFDGAGSDLAEQIATAIRRR